MPVTFRYEPSKEGIARCAVGPELKHAVTSIARQALDYAELISPDGFETSGKVEVGSGGRMRDVAGGSYAGQFEVINEIMVGYPERWPMNRHAAILVNNSPLAVLVEVGGAHSKDYRIMARTLDWIERVNT